MPPRAARLQHQPARGGAPGGDRGHELGGRRATVDLVAAGLQGRRPPPRRPAGEGGRARRRRAAAPARSAGAAAGPPSARRPCHRPDPPVGHEDDAVGQALDVGQVVARQEDRDALAAQLVEDRRGSPRAPPGPSPPSARRGWRPPAGRPARPRARAAAARHRTGAGRRPRDVGQPDERRAARRASRGSAWNAAYCRSISRGRAADVERRRPGASARPARGAPRPPVADPCRARGRVPSSAAPIALDDLDGRRLAGAVRPEQRDELARSRPTKETPSTTVRPP